MNPTLMGLSGYSSFHFLAMSLPIWFATMDSSTWTIGIFSSVGAMK